MKERKYPLFGEWLEKSRGSHSLQWIGNRIGKEHNTVSDYAKGYVKPPKLIAACLINLFNADPLEIADFLYYDPNELKALCNYLNVSGYSTCEFRDDSWTRLIAARELRESGKLIVAEQVIDELILQLDARIKADIETGKSIKDLQFILLKAYGERVILTTLLKPRAEIINITIHDRSQMVTLSIELEGKAGNLQMRFPNLSTFKAIESYAFGFSSFAFSDSCIAASYFVSENFEEAINYQIKAIPICGFDTHLLADTYRGLVLGMAHLNRVNDFIVYENEINHQICDGKFDEEDTNSLRLAFAEGRILLGMDGAKNIISEVENSISGQKIFYPLKTIQFYKTKLFDLISDHKRNRYIDHNYVKSILRDGSSLAKSYGYSRHAKEIEQLSNTILNDGQQRNNSPRQLNLGFV